LGKRTTAFLAAFATTVSLQTASFAGETNESPEQIIERVNQILVKGAKPSEKDCEALGEIIAGQPNNLKAHLTLGLAYEAMGLPEQSLEQYKIAVQLDPNNPRPLADLLRQRINTKQMDNSSQLTMLAVKKFPNDAEVLFYAGYIELENHDMSGAESLLSKAYTLDPKIPLLKSSLAECKLNKHNFAQAFVLAEEELRQNPNVPRADMVAGLALVHLQRYDQAVDLLDKACIAMPSRWDLAEKLARVAVWSGRYQDAILPICLFLAQRTDSGSDQKKMCALLLECLRRTNRQDALNTINNVSQKFDPAAHNAYYHNAVGQVLAQVGLNDAATTQFKEAVKLAPLSSQANFNLGKQYEFYVHDYGKALDYYKKAEVGTDVAQTQATDYANRLEDRLARSQSDVAWRLRDLLTTPHQQ
jgi:tetratricopeptide (TPR) repeat protein